MVDDRVETGRRVAELLASEIEGREDAALRPVSVTNADQSIEPTPDGTRAFDISLNEAVIGRVYIHPNRARLELTAGQIAAREVVESRELEWRAGTGAVPKLLIFLPDGVAVKRVLPVLNAAAGAHKDD